MRTPTAKRIPTIAAVPPLKIARRKNGGGVAAKFKPCKTNRFAYETQEHSAYPHVVKFSGGRSSGMLLFLMLENGLLNPQRGDVVVFNNTSAEHPATYEFARQCKDVTERKYGIPFFWAEFQTYEDVYKGCWWRMPTYRLVNSHPHSADNPHGYHCKGEVFEELVSWKGFVPNQHSRICTERMKLFVTKEFLRDWFAVKPGIDWLGHYGECSRLVDDDIHALHLRNHGNTPREVFLKKKEFLRNRPVARHEQQFDDYSSVGWRHIKNPLISRKNIGGRVDLSGDNCLDYLSFVGLRADEPHRVARTKARNNGSANDSESPDPATARPEGEFVYMPLAELGVEKQSVTDFWQSQNWGLQLPDGANLSNCVFCFLKGRQNIIRIIADKKKIEKGLPPKLRSVPGTPTDIQWWKDLEDKYGRDLEEEARAIRNAARFKEKPIIGFFGTNGMSYGFLKKAGESGIWANGKGPSRNFAAELSNAGLSDIPCDCTD